MALAAVGLKTYIWNNEAKSVLLLAGYPFLILVVIWLVCASMQAVFNVEGVQAVNVFGQMHDVSTLTPVQAGFDGIRQYWSVAVVITAAWFTFAFFFHQNMINAATGAEPVTRAQQSKLYNLLENLCISRGLAMPALYIVDTPALNAYASGIGPKSYAITVTRGLLELLDEKELEAVLGHELSHIINHDSRLMIIGIVFAGMFTFLLQMFGRGLSFSNYRSSRGDSGGRIWIFVLAMWLALTVANILGAVIRFALSRRRELLADAGSVELTQDADALVSALQKISQNPRLPDVPNDVQQLFIINPSSVTDLFDTHPDIDERIEALVRYGGAHMPTQAAPQTSFRGPWG